MTAPVYESEDLDDGSENRRGKIVQEDGSLLIFNTRVADQGVYKCVAINVIFDVMRQDKKSVNLTVKKGKNRISHLPFLNNLDIDYSHAFLLHGGGRIAWRSEGESPEEACCKLKRNQIVKPLHCFTYLGARAEIYETQAWMLSFLLSRRYRVSRPSFESQITRVGKREWGFALTPQGSFVLSP